MGVDKGLSRRIGQFQCVLRVSCKACGVISVRQVSCRLAIDQAISRMVDKGGNLVEMKE
jgi:hypothetical protein